MPDTRRPDSITQHAALAERVRKLEVMPHTRPVTNPTWRPSYEDAYAIAGHIYMLGCFDFPIDPSPGGGTAYVSQAAQYLWATLDQQGFRSQAEGEDWTLFLKRLGALPTWPRYRPGSVTMTDSALAGAELAECRPAQAYETHVRTGWASGDGDPPDQTQFRYRALYWHGLPEGLWEWQNAGVLPDNSSYQLWDSDGLFDEGTFLAPIQPLISQSNFWQQSPGPPEVLVPCESIGGYYNSGAHPGEPLVYDAGPLECPGKPAGIIPDPVGIVLRARLVLPAHDLSLISPPRVMDPSVRTSDYWHASVPGGGTPHESGPGLQWLAEGAEAILADHPQVASFYSDHLPAAYNNKLRGHHYNWQQLETSLTVRGRVEARKEPDRVILKGRVHCFSEQLTAAGLFRFPDTWPDPAMSAGQGIYLAASDQGPVLINSGGTSGGGGNSRRFYLETPWIAAHDGPVTVSFDGMIIPLTLA